MTTTVFVVVYQHYLYADFICESEPPELKMLAGDWIIVGTFSSAVAARYFIEKEVQEECLLEDFEHEDAPEESRREMIEHISEDHYFIKEQEVRD